MQLVYSSRKLEVRQSVEEVLSAAAGRGFDGAELTIDLEGDLRFDTSLAECRETRRRAEDLGVKVASLCSPAFWKINLGDADAEGRRKAREITSAMLERGAALGADAIIVMPAVVGTEREDHQRTGYADALAWSFEGLSGLVGECEAAGVTLAVSNAENRFLASPVETAGLIDRINSGYVGACLDLDALLGIGYGDDWIRTLGGRLKYIRTSEVERLEGAAAERAALEGIGYEGALCYAGAGDAREVCRRWRGG